MPDQTVDQDEVHQAAPQQTANNTQGAELSKDEKSDAGRPMQQDAREQLAQANSNELQQAWPELNAADEKQLKQAVEKVLDQINEFQGNVDDLVKESPEITRMLSEAADEFVDKALRDVTATVSDARESGGANLDQTLQRLDDVSNRIEGAQNRLDQDVREAPEASRQSLLEDASRSQDEMKKSLWEMNGYELEKSQMADFRRDAGLPNEGLVTRPEEGELFGANVSMKKLIDNIEEFANVERAGKEQNQAESGRARRALGGFDARGRAAAERRVP
jgi:hypothetical protein